jgi:hypothetical protein
MAMLATDLTDEQRALWIARLKTGAPDNALANYYAAADHFRQKNGEAAVAELAAAGAKESYDDYVWATVEERRALFIAAGLSPLEAGVHALFGTPLNYLKPVSGLSQGLVPLIETAVRNGDVSGASELANLGGSVADKIRSGSGSGVILNELVAIALERKTLQALEPTAPAALDVTPLKGRLEELNQRREEILQLAQAPTSLPRTCPVRS